MFPYQKAQVSFQKIEEIGFEGQNSKVYRAHDEYLDAELVIKEVEKKDGFSADEYFSEARTLYKSSHPNVVQVGYACEDESKIYVASPFYRNGSLNKRMQNEFLTVREIIRYSTHALNGLHNVHSKGLIHFDVKPDNILISDRNEALLADFGLTQVMDEEGIAKQPMLYIKQMPPEVFGNREKEFDNRFDIYQVGLTMYRMCVGNGAFYEQFSVYSDGQQFAKDVRGGKFPDRKAYPLHIPKKLQHVINKCLKPNPGDRYGTAVEVVNAIAEIDGPILHWKYLPSDQEDKWEQELDGTSKSIIIDNRRTSLAYRHRVNSPPRRVQAFCKPNITDAEIIEFLEQ
ncbi:serine/threonine-protein kinase [Salinivibrio sp. ML198]|uniref:serine/threonine-protein kinase n=1 Tax=Salinivibrio sp. ML198 TaxID=1909458 RepID=UPI00098946AD|nr:serine/threonine-protein kinase [Salinivibrio sp. ML198]